MTKALYGVSPIGLGHASRAVAMGGELVASGVDVTFATGGPAAPFLRSYGFDVKRLGPLIAERIGKRAEPRNFDGARMAADKILGFI